ncbi:MAG TPA: hypothetical protein VK208_14135 [Pyrinomonadaceae bacterium]|nr:hypothetical protein [Pyrinomonadaceae bacterium]
MGESPPKRLNYFTGRVLTAGDFQLEQDYFRQKLKRHNRALHGFGIVAGLKVSIQSGQIIVEPGLALDCEGNELMIANAQTAAPPQPTGNTSLYLSVRFVEEETDLVPSLGEPLSETESFATATITESFELAFTKENYNRCHRHLRARWLPCGEPHPLTIAKLKAHAHRWHIDRGYRPPTIR